MVLWHEKNMPKRADIQRLKDIAEAKIIIKITPTWCSINVT